jgi:hypothetical protein
MRTRFLWVPLFGSVSDNLQLPRGHGTLAIGLWAGLQYSSTTTATCYIGRNL